MARLVDGTLYCGPAGGQESQGKDTKCPPHAQARLHFRDHFHLFSSVGRPSGPSLAAAS